MVKKEITVEWLVTRFEDTEYVRTVELESETGITIKAKCWRNMVYGLNLNLIGQKPTLKLERYYSKEGEIAYKVLKVIEKPYHFYRI